MKRIIYSILCFSFFSSFGQKNEERVYVGVAGLNPTMEIIAQVITQSDTLIENKIYDVNEVSIEGYPNFNYFIFTYDSLDAKKYRSSDGLDYLLYDSSLEIGDEWMISENIRVKIDSICFSKIGELTLKNLHVSYSSPKTEFENALSYCSIITEKLGDQTFFLNLKSSVDPDFFHSKYLFTYSDLDVMKDTIGTEPVSSMCSLVLGLSNTNSVELGVEVYPNQVESSFTVSGIDYDTEYSFRIFNLTGEMKSSGHIFSGEPIEVRELESGLYYIELFNASKSKTLRFVKE